MKQTVFPDPRRGADRSGLNQRPNNLSKGISQRLYIATKIMSRLVTIQHGLAIIQHDVKYAFEIADELIKQDK